MSETYKANKVVDSTAPWGSPEGVCFGIEFVPFRWTVKV
jgi:hypothetical protein